MESEPDGAALRTALAGSAPSPAERRLARPEDPRRSLRLLRVLRYTVYWALVLGVSLILVILLLGFFESRDASEVGAACDRALATRVACAVRTQ